MKKAIALYLCVLSFTAPIFAQEKPNKTPDFTGKNTLQEAVINLAKELLTKHCAFMKQYPYLDSEYQTLLDETHELFISLKPMLEKLKKHDGELAHLLEVFEQEMANQTRSRTSLNKAPRDTTNDLDAPNVIVGKDGESNSVALIAQLGALKKAIDMLEEIICDKFEQTWTILADIEEDIFDTKTVMCEKFEQTWTILAALNVTVTVDLSSVFTELQKIEGDIFNTQTILCNKFEQTWTILANIDEDIFVTKTVLCEKFNGTFTVLESLRTGCPTIPISQADVDSGGGTFTINAPGNYALIQDITSDLDDPDSGIFLVTTSNVSIDLCGRSITANLENPTSGIFVQQGLVNIHIKNGTISQCACAGIQIRQGCCDISLDMITSCSNYLGFAIGGRNIISSNIFMQRCQSTNCLSFVNRDRKAKRPYRILSNPQGGLFLDNCLNVSVLESNFSNNTDGEFLSPEADVVIAVQVVGCFNCFFSHCTMDFNQAQEQAIGLALNSSDQNTFESCTFNRNTQTDSTLITNQALGISLFRSSNNVFRNCQAQQNLGFVVVAGFQSESGRSNSFINCIANNNFGPGAGFLFENESGSTLNMCQSLRNSATVSATDDCAGFQFSDGMNNVLKDCIAVENNAQDVAAGFRLTNEMNSSLLQCVAQQNESLAQTGYGILLDTVGGPCTSCFVKQCCVTTTTGIIDHIGYADNASPNSTNLFTGNFAFDNGTNYSVVYPSGMLPTVSGSLSGGLPANGTSGTFDNIDINL